MSEAAITALLALSLATLPQDTSIHDKPTEGPVHYTTEHFRDGKLAGRHISYHENAMEPLPYKEELVISEGSKQRTLIWKDKDTKWKKVYLRGIKEPLLLKPRAYFNMQLEAFKSGQPYFDNERMKKEKKLKKKARQAQRKAEEKRKRTLVKHQTKPKSSIKQPRNKRRAYKAGDTRKI